MLSIISAFFRYTPKLFSLIVVLWTALTCLAADKIDVQFPDGPFPDTQVNVLQRGDLLFINLNQFAVSLNLPVYINEERNKIQYSVGSAKLKLAANNAFVTLGEQIYQLPDEVILHNNAYWAPLDAFLEIFRRIYPAAINYERYQWRLVITPSDYNVYAIEYDVKENGTLIRLSCTQKFDISGAALRDGKLSITLLKAKLNVDSFKATPTLGAVKSLIIDKLPESYQLTFVLRDDVLEHTVWQTENPHQIVISLVTSLIEPDSIYQNESESGAEISQLLESEQQRWNIDCIVIDPGHGGKDPGALGYSGLKEKAVVLDIARRLRDLLEKKTELNIVLTRDDDSFISLNNRTKKANQAGGKLFVSIHCNSSTYKSAHGFSTYFLKPAKNESAMEVALKENSVIKYEESKSEYQDLTEENYILLGMAQAEFAKESEYMASLVQKNVRLRTNLRDRGVDQAGFYVLVGASMPAILFEAPFLSNSGEEKLLKQKKFRQKVAQAIYDSIMEFKSSVEDSRGYSSR